ncbi:MAG: TusE/DsrC/DsvC family sulfur relay protein [Desulfurella sp.]|uniref:TusE/DsrC/DsvC family sulfur relay protein n=1 Tax=Desulfurella sp. TaxID=1962857 RepID=UPI003D139E44
MGVLIVGERSIQTDDEGYLVNFSDWSKEVAEVIAKQEGIENLTDRHWLVIEFMQKEFKEHGSGPSIRKLTKESGVSTKELYELFPKGPAKKAAKIAGIKKPVGCV